MTSGWGKGQPGAGVETADFVKEPLGGVPTQATVRGVPFWGLKFSGQGSVARVTPLLFCYLTFSSCFIFTKSIHNAQVI